MSEKVPIGGHENANYTSILVTGANGGLGLAICRRLILTFISTRPYQSLHLIVTTRSATKNASTLSLLHAYIARNSYPQSRIILQACVLDLCSLPSVLAICRHLNSTLPRIDVLILNAGLGGFIGINWPLAIYTQLTNFRSALTYPTYKIASRGLLLPPQPLPSTSSSPTKKEEQPPLGQVFTSNVFGHYFLIHHLLPLLPHSRILWISSLEAHASAFNINDIQALDSVQAYESSKRLTDLLVLTSSLSSTSPYTNAFHTPPSSQTPPSAPTRNETLTHHLIHPGICSTSFLPLPLPLFYLEILFFHIVRLFFNSPWHTIDPYKGAVAPVWAALASQDELEAPKVGVEEKGSTIGKYKWGSSTNRWGHESVVKTAVQGLWKADTSNHIYPNGSEEMENFEQLGRECWRQMEDMRAEWEDRLGT